MANVASLEARPSDSPMSRETMEAQLKELAPFHHNVELPHGLSTYRADVARHGRELTRVDSLERLLWPRLLEMYGGSLEGKRVLDIACNCGGFSIRAAQAGAAEVVGVDMEPYYIRQANFVRDALGLENVRYEERRLEDITPETHGRFDIVFFFGILYHLENPIDALKRISAVTRDLLAIDTSMLRLPYINRFVRSPLWGMKLVEPIREDSYDLTTGRWRKQRFCQFYPNIPAVEQSLDYVGFENVEYIKPSIKGLEPRYYKGKRATFLARRNTPLTD